MSFKANITTTNDLPPETLDGVRMMIGQLPIVWALREGGQIRVPVREVDATGAYMLNMELDTKGAEPAFVFTVRQKQ